MPLGNRSKKSRIFAIRFNATDMPHLDSVHPWSSGYSGALLSPFRRRIFSSMKSIWKTPDRFSARFSFVYDSQYCIQQARQKHIPLLARTPCQFSILPLAIDAFPNHVLCPICPAFKEMERRHRAPSRGNLRTVEEWVRLAEQMAKGIFPVSAFSSSDRSKYFGFSRCSFRILKRCRSEMKRAGSSKSSGHDSYYQYKRNSAGRSLG